MKERLSAFKINLEQPTNWVICYAYITEVET